MNLIVLYVSDVEHSLTFYAALGLRFTEEQHGAGPAHHAAVLAGDLVLELYPRGRREASRNRLGFRVPSVAHTIAEITLRGFEVRDAAPRVLDYGTVVVVQDPDGNNIELVEPST